MVDHRGPEFAGVIRRVTDRLKPFFQTQNDILTLTTAGTGGLESAVVNFLSPGQTVLAVSIGVFGDRFAKIASVYGANVIKLRFDDGTPADPEKVRQALKDNPEVTAVTITHNETSTGVTNHLGPLANVIKDEGKLLLVDAVSSLGAIDCPVDEWNLDVVVTGSQKGWMVPPGLAFVSVSDEAWKANETAKMPRFYFDLKEAKLSLEKNQTPWTPALPIYFGLDVALEKMTAEGLPAILARHQAIADRVRGGVKDLGLKLVADERYASNTVTAVWVPEGIKDSALRNGMREEGVHVAGGQGALTGKIFRIGHLGYVSMADVDDALRALKASLGKLGVLSAATA